jgi:hypothetical protein
MEKDIRHVGLDVETERIAAAVAEPEGEVRSLGVIPYREESMRRLVKKLGPASRLRVCYEAGPSSWRSECRSRRSSSASTGTVAPPRSTINGTPKRKAQGCDLLEQSERRSRDTRKGGPSLVLCGRQRA